MDTIEKVLNSNQNLTVDESMDISIGTVELPKGSRLSSEDYKNQRKK